MKNKDKTKKRDKSHRRRIVVWTEISLIVLGLFVMIVAVSLTSARKPAIYLYPEEDQNISVNLDVKGWITSSHPKYKGGWDVFVEKGGLIDNKYDYLAYEASLWDVELPDKGWVVDYDNLNTWFGKKLPRLGLNKKEARQFKDYWLEKLPRADYYEIKLLSGEFLAKNMVLDIQPEPDTVIRRIFYFTPLKERKVLKEPPAEDIKREGFVVVEWGGILAK